MIIALDENNNKIDINNAIKGKIYFCPLCHAELIQKHGVIKEAHFAHKHKCTETWNRDMSPWHFWWQRQFPIEFCECVLESKGNIHRTDVFLNKQKTVIEFQHSPISRNDFLERNQFYIKLGYRVVWVFDLTNKEIEGLLEIYSEYKTIKKIYGFPTLQNFNFNNQIVTIFFQTRNDGDLFNSLRFYNDLKNEYPYRFNIAFEEFKNKYNKQIADIYLIESQSINKSFLYKEKFDKEDFLKYVYGLQPIDISGPINLFKIPIINRDIFSKETYRVVKKYTPKSFDEIKNSEPDNLLNLWDDRTSYRLRAVNKLTGDIVTITKSPIEQVKKYNKVYGEIYLMKNLEYYEGVNIYNFDKKIWVRI